MVRSFGRDHEGMPKRLTVLAYALFGFAIVLAGVAVVGALLVGIDSETAWSMLLDHQHRDRSLGGTLRSPDRPRQARTTRSVGSSSSRALPHC